MRFDPQVKREIGFVALGTLLLTAAEIGVFCAVGEYSANVLYGAILSASAGILNFFLLAVTVTRVLTYSPEEEAAAKGLMKLSRVARMLFLLAALAVGVLLFSRWSTLITIFFPRIIIGVRSVSVRRASALTAPTDASDEPARETDNDSDNEKGSEENGTDEN